MKILHLCLGCFYIDNYSYQENMLPKYHKKMGYDVEIIASTLSFDSNGDSCNVTPRKYKNEYGIKVTRLPYKKHLPTRISKFLRLYEGLNEALKNANPDIIFIHGGQFCDINIVRKYAKKHNITIYVDNHADFSNSATNFMSKNILHRFIWRKCLRKIEPYTKKFYGVLPARVDFLKNIYKMPNNKCELLVMGADDELISKSKATNARNKIRNKYKINSNDFLIITGGKIDRWKTQTLLLMQAVKNIDNDKIKLIVFGSTSRELKSKVQNLSDGKKVQYIGWIQSNESYNYFEAADLIVFPGRHSVMWEQAAGQGKPLVVKDWAGTHHIDLGGNVKFIKNDSVEEIQKIIENLVSNPKEYETMKKIAIAKGSKEFSYEEISKKAIEY